MVNTDELTKKKPKIIHFYAFLAVIAIIYAIFFAIIISKMIIKLAEYHHF